MYFIGGYERMSLLKDKGFERYNLRDILPINGMDEDLNELKKEFTQLPEDSYAKGLNRYRQYGRAVIIPGSNTVKWLPTVQTPEREMYKYFQGSFNPEFINSARDFHAIPKAIRNNELLNNIILFDYNQTFWRKEDLLLPVHVGVHFVKLQVHNEGDLAVSSPNNLHQDGEPFTFAHLLHRDNVEGGENLIGTPEIAGMKPEEVTEKSNLIAQMTLKEPLESYGVFDPLVSHYVAPVKRGQKETSGERSIILIDFQPTVIPALVDTKQMILI